MKLQSALLGLAKDGAEQRAIDAGEIDAVIDYANSNVILLPAARRALREAAGEAPRREAPIANELLAALPRAEYQDLLASLEPLTLRLGSVLQRPAEPIACAYFPIDCVISLLATAEDGRSTEVGLVGHEGMLGIPLALGADVSSIRARVQSSGTALRIEAASFRHALARHPRLHQVLRRYAVEKLATARQSVACGSFHAVNARLARWMLTMSDRARSGEFFLTQQSMAELLGVRRATINEAAGPLQERGLISFTRGRIRILDRQRLAAACCSCYAEERRRRAMSAY